MARGTRIKVRTPQQLASKRTVIDAELLERVALKHLEAVDVQDADEGPLLGGTGRRERGVDAHHQPVEHSAVQVHGERVWGKRATSV